MTRDRLAELRKISGFSSSQCDFNDVDSIVQIEMEPIDHILDQYSDIRKGLETIACNLNSMKKILHTENLRHFYNEDMDQLRQQNLTIGNKLIGKFKDFKSNLPDSDDFTLQARIKRTLFYGMYQEYVNLWTENEKFLQTYETKLKKNLTLHSKILNRQQSEEEVEELIANKQTSLFVDNILEETEKERRQLRSLLERYSELEKLERSIVEVHALFLRIQNLILEQSDRIQVVEYHAQQASVRVDKGADNLEKARELKMKTLKWKTCLIVGALVFIIILILLAFIY